MDTNHEQVLIVDNSEIFAKPNEVSIGLLGAVLS
jgi:hypothetical protein